MAVGVDRRSGGRAGEAQRVGFLREQGVDELLKEQAPRGHLLRAVQAQLAVVLAEHGPAGGLQEDHRLRAAAQQFQIAPAKVPRGAEHAHAEGGPPAAGAPGGQRHPEARRLKHAHGGAADVGLVEAHEAVVPEDDPPARFRRGGRGAADEPAVEAVAGVGGQGALFADAEQGAHHAAGGRPCQHKVGDAGRGAAQLAEQVHAAEDAGGQGRAVAAVPRVEQFGLEQGQVHVGGAFGGAGAAGQAVADGLFQLVGEERPRRGFDAPLQHGPDDVGPAPGGHELLAGGLEGGAHGGPVLAAAAAAVALLQVAREGLVLGGVGQHRVEGHGNGRAVALAQARVAAPFAGVDYLAGVEQVRRIEGMLHPAHDVEQHGADMLRHKLGVGDAHAVLAGDGAAEFGDQSGHLRLQLPEAADVFALVHVHHGPHMEQARSGMAVEGGPEAGAVEYFAEAGHVFGQRLRRHAHVLDARRGLGAAGAAGEQGQARLAQVPHLRHFARVGGGQEAAAQPHLFEQRQLLPLVVVKFHDEYGGAGAGVQVKQLPRRREGRLAPGLVEEQIVYLLDGGGPERQQRRHRLECVVDGVKKQQAQPLGLGRLHRADLCGEDEGEGALAAADELGKVHAAGARPEVAVQAVAGPALGEAVMKAGEYFLRVRRDERVHGRQTVAQVGAVRAEHRHRPVGQHHLHAFHMVDRRAVDRRARARGVVGDHAAEGGAGTGGHVGAEDQPVPLQEGVQLVEHHARADAHGARFGVEFRNAPVVAGQFHDDARTQRAARQPAARAPRRERHPRRGRGAHQRRRFRGAFWKGHPEGLHLVDRRVGGVQLAGERVAAHLATGGAGQFPA